MTSLRAVVAICHYFESDNERSYYPSNYHLNPKSVDECYWKTICAFFYFSTAFNSDFPHVFITNLSLDGPIFVDDVDVVAYLKSLGVTCHYVDFTYRAPAGASLAFAASNYKLDAIRWLSYQDYDAPFLLSESDVVITGPLAPLLKEFESSGVSIFLREGKNNPSLKVNGFSSDDIASIFSAKAVNTSKSPRFLCGDFALMTCQGAREFIKHLDVIFEKQNRAFSEGASVFSTEEHYYTYISYCLGSQVSILPIVNPYIKALWNTLSFNNVETGDELKLMWHMAGQKKFAFVRIFKPFVIAKTPVPSIRELKRLFYLSRFNVMHLTERAMYAFFMKASRFKKLLSQIGKKVS